MASFFVSRVDTEVDARLDALGADPALKGLAAVAQAQARLRASSPRRSRPLASRRSPRAVRAPQRPLWASTSTKNPAYPDLLYVDTLIGPITVNTMPDATIEAFRDHGMVARTVDADLDGARATRSQSIEAAGVSMEDVATMLEDKGVASFAESYAELLATIESKRATTLTARRPPPAAS